MRLFLRITAVYAVLGMLFVLLFRDQPLLLIADTVRTVPQSFGLFVQRGWWLLLPLIPLLAMTGRAEVLARLPAAFLGTFACGAFFLTFTMVKSSLTHAVPFHAGPALADLDRWLHFGIDPWRIAHLASPLVNADLAAAVYASLWFVPAMYFPALLRLFDGDEVRIHRFVVLFAFVWIILGNVMAIAGMSEGPVFAAAVSGDRSFDPMMSALASSGVLQSATGQTQDFLWDLYRSGNAMAGSGISAFPSVHVGMVTVLAAYLTERLPRLLLPAALLVAVYQFLSVYLGWHYAVDGYVSILAVVLLHRWLRRRAFDLYPGAPDARGAADIVTRRHN